MSKTKTVPTFQRRHHDDETWDDIRIVCVPRYKTSGLSGDEWRVSYVLSFARKGTVVFERPFTSLKAAVAALPWFLLAGIDSDEEAGKAWSRRVDLDSTTCAQPSCGAPATVRVRFKQIFAPNGEGPLPNESGLRYVTQFCARHSTRGDCGREDRDDNYEVIEGDLSPPLAKDESPSVFGGVIDARGSDAATKIADALRKKGPR